MRATRYQPLLAEALTIVGSLGDLCDDPGTAIERLKEGYAAGVAGHDDAMATQAAVIVPVLAANRMGQTALANDWARIARATLERMGGNARLEGYLLSAEGAVAGASRDFDRWIELARRAQDVTQRALGRIIPWPSSASPTSATRSHRAVGTKRRSRPIAPRASPPSASWGRIPARRHDLEQRLRGAQPPGSVLRGARRLPAALAIWRAAGTDAAIRWYGLTGVGLALLGEGRAAEAVAPLEEAVPARVGGHLAPALLGESRFALARALWSRPSARPRALALARQARTDAASDGGPSRPSTRGSRSP